MSDELNGVAVPSTDVPVAIDPALMNKPVRPEDAQVGNADSELLKHKLGLANAHAKQAKKEADDARQAMQQLKDELEQVKAIQQSAAQKSLEDQGQFRDLWEQAKRSVSDRDAQILELKAQLESVTQNAQQERLKAAATAQISQANAVNPVQLYQLLQSQLRMDDEGNPAVLSGGVEQPLGDYIANLRQSPDWQHHFGASGARGMGSAPVSSVAPGMDNPYRSGNLTAALSLEMSNPELARALKAEALRG
jgi:hypothetical protein